MSACDVTIKSSHLEQNEAIVAAPAKRTISVRYDRPRRGPWLQIDSLAGFEWNRVELGLSDLPEALAGIRIVHLTDLHLRQKWQAEHEELIRRLNERPPALILFTGDFVDDKHDHRPALPTVERLIRGLPKSSLRFATIGNHDGDLMPPRLASYGLPVIVHQRVEVSINGHPIELIGLPGPDRQDVSERFLHDLPPRRTGVPRIILCHYPDLIRAARRLRPDLYLAGHTHGGQICLPNEFPMMTHDSLPRRLSKGAHDVGGTCLVVGRGFGFTTFPVRAWCPAEVIEVELKEVMSE